MTGSPEGPTTNITSLPGSRRSRALEKVGEKIGDAILRGFPFWKSVRSVLGAAISPQDQKKANGTNGEVINFPVERIRTPNP